jgi:hypothetical protein
MAYNNPVQKKESPCKQLKSETGKPTGLMMEGSLAYMESPEQERENLETKDPIPAHASDTKQAPDQNVKEIKSKATEYKPIDNRGVGEMSPYKMDSAFHNTGYGDKLATKKEKAEMNKKPAGFNIFPPSNPKDKSSFKQPILDSSSPGYDVARPLYDSNKDGDTVFSDLNQDGTLVGRAIRKLFG